MARLDIDVDFDADEAHDKMDRIKKRGRNFKPVMEAIRAELRKAWTANFTSNGLAVGGWAPLDAEYASWKAAHFPGATPLIQTGNLFKSIASLRGVEVDLDRHGARFSLADIRVAKFHQYGTTRMPKREIVFEPAGARGRWAEWMKDYIQEGRNKIEGM